jgi:hypothetical protein
MQYGADPVVSRPLDERFSFENPPQTLHPPQPLLRAWVEPTPLALRAFNTYTVIHAFTVPRCLTRQPSGVRWAHRADRLAPYADTLRVRLNFTACSFERL